jgi:hypothetical protein
MMMTKASSILRGFVGGAALVVLALSLTGCGGYALRGKVVQGPTSGFELVHEIDQRLKGPGIQNAEVMVRRDPQSLHPHLAGRDRTGANGDFAVPIGEFGAGWMEEQWLVQAAMSGYQNAELEMKLPAKGSKWRLLITLAPGSSTPLDQPDDVMGDYERFK